MADGQDDLRALGSTLVHSVGGTAVLLTVLVLNDPTEAEDVAQEAFLKAYRALASFRGDSAFYTWLYRIAINTAKNHLVAAGRKPVSYDLDTQDPEQAGILNELRDMKNEIFFAATTDRAKETFR